MRGYYNFDQAYAPQQNIIERPDFTNKGNVIHNNLGQNLLTDHVSEYKLKINSADRNIASYPSIFKQRIVFDDSCGFLRSFKGVKYIQIDTVVLPRSFAIDISKISIPDSAFDSSRNLVNQSVTISDIYPANSRYNQNFNVTGTLNGSLTWNETIGTSGYFTGTISTTSVTNLTGTITGTMYITSYNSDTSEYTGTFSGAVSNISEALSGTFTATISSGSVTANLTGVLSFTATALPSTRTSSYAWNHPYIYIKVEEMSTDKNMGTSTIISNNTYTYRYDGLVGNDMTLWKPMSAATVIFQGSRLGNLSKFNITILDENGQELCLTDLEGNRLVGNPLNLLNSNISSYYTGDYNSFVQTFYNNQTVKYTNSVTQVNINFTVGVLENELNTQNNY
jgi:hypothetical protein